MAFQGDWHCNRVPDAAPRVIEFTTASVRRIGSGPGLPISIERERLSREHRNRCTADNDQCENHRDTQREADGGTRRAKSELAKCIFPPGATKRAADNEREKKRGQQRDHSTCTCQLHQNWHEPGLRNQSRNDRLSQRIGENKASEETERGGNPDRI